VSDLDHRIETIKSKIATAGNLDLLLDALVDLETKRKAAHEAAEAIRRELTTREGEALDRTRELVEKLQSAKRDEAYHLRLRLRSRLKRLIQDIVVLVIQVNRDRVAIADIQLHGGKRRQVMVMPGQVIQLPEELDGRDVRDWARWPEKLRKTRFSVVSHEVQRIMDLEDAGYSRTEIAEEAGLSKSQVSRILTAQGRRKQDRKRAEDRLMSWHARGNGWGKRHKGKRYFIGLGKLKTLYPKLVLAKTEDGSWRAANRPDRFLARLLFDLFDRDAISHSVGTERSSRLSRRALPRRPEALGRRGRSRRTQRLAPWLEFPFR